MERRSIRVAWSTALPKSLRRAARLMILGPFASAEATASQAPATLPALCGDAIPDALRGLGADGVARLADGAGALLDAVGDGGDDLGTRRASPSAAVSAGSCARYASSAAICCSLTCAGLAPKRPSMAEPRMLPLARSAKPYTAPATPSSDSGMALSAASFASASARVGASASSCAHRLVDLGRGLDVLLADLAELRQLLGDERAPGPRPRRP